MATAITPTTDGRYQWRFCDYPGCTAVYLANIAGSQESQYCPPHRAKNLHREYEVARKHSHVKPENRKRNVNITYDPEGCFAGRVFTDDFCWTLRKGYFPNGLRATIAGIGYTVVDDCYLEDAEGRRYYSDKNQTIKPWRG